MNTDKGMSNSKLSNECCICKGETIPSISGSCYLIVNGVEYRVYYHKACFSESTKTIVEEALRHEMNSHAKNEK